MLWEDACTRTHRLLSEYSVEYKQLKDRKNKIMAALPTDVVKVFEGDPVGHDLMLDEGMLENLSGLIRTSMDLLWLYEKAFYLIGMTVGIEISKITEIVGKDITR